MDGKNLKKYCLFLAITLAIGFFIAIFSKHLITIFTKKDLPTKIETKNLVETCINIFDTKQEPETKETWLNVFVHGIISIVPVLSLKTMNYIKLDNLENTVYKEYVKNVRQNPFFCQHEPKQDIGLKPVYPEKNDTRNSSSVIAKLFDIQFQDSINYYYTFGWSGLMSNKARYIDAKNFYTELSQEIKKFHEKGIYPKIRLIGFSHGGSTCLFIAKVIKEENLPLLFNIDELILLGTPIIQETKNLVTEPVFKKIYNFYSGLDRVQILDFSQENAHFSRRKFKSTKNFNIKDNLLQIKLEILRPIKNKNGEITEPIKWKKSPARHSVGIRKNSPGHCEWWFLKYTNTFYRDTFALSPLPILAFIPTIINSLNNNEFKTNKTKLFGNQINLKIRPFEYYMEIESENNKTKLDFLSRDKFKMFKDIIYKLNFEKTTKKMYNDMVSKELNKAKIKIENYTKKQEKIKKLEKKHARKQKNN